jgi:hypothetical protein
MNGRTGRLEAGGDQEHDRPVELFEVVPNRFEGSGSVPRRSHVIV